MGVAFLKMNDLGNDFVWNPDGSESGACGNGTRCVADLLFNETKPSSLTIATKGGLLYWTRAADGRVKAPEKSAELGS